MEITEYSIALKEMHIFAHHGVMPQEREIGAWFTIDIELEIGEHGCTRSDDINGTVSYADVYDIVCREMEIPSNLMENVCKRISDTIYSTFPGVNAMQGHPAHGRGQTKSCCNAKEPKITILPPTSLSLHGQPSAGFRASRSPLQSHIQHHQPRHRTQNRLHLSGAPHVQS